ncbi:dimethylargininase [Aeromicrobium fastidiosum]|nr:dimethylargininase [Aeromicrobium fastidiosum]MBP2390738.1 N-dimethylarginine dimethylaminohydrolase [Aeromicrobium fastidiosum]
MTVIDTRAATGPSPRIDVPRAARPRHYLMCTPSHFEIAYAINPWMDLDTPVDVERARLQWEVLRNTYLSLGHRVDLIDPLPGQPDMVFAANGGLVIGGRAYGARFRFAERSAEGGAYAAWLTTHGYRVTEPTRTNEGEGDFLALGAMILAGTGFRTSLDAHIEAADALDRPVVSLELVDPRFYHLDVAIAVLDDGNGETPADIAYYPGAFSPHSRRTLRDLFPDAILCSEDDALVLGLNAVSDGHHVVLPSAATGLAEAVRRRGYTPVPVDLSEFMKSGGSVKCCTMELHR